MPAIRLPLGDVGDMHFDDGDADGADAVGEGDRGVGIASRVHHHGVILAVGLLQLVDQDTFVVGLEIGDLVLGETLAELGQVFFEREISVNLGFALA